MNTMLDCAFFQEWIEETATALDSSRDHLTQLDAAIGDADHGTNMARGMTAVRQALRTADLKSPGQLLTLVGSTLISNVGGAAGPLYGTAFRKAGKAMGESEEVDVTVLAAALEASLTGVMKLGAALEGEKTMVDALAPAVRAFATALDEGGAGMAPFDALAVAADQGAKATIPLQARKGRASYLGPRSVGHEDPGAASTAIILATLRSVAARRAAG